MANLNSTDRENSDIFNINVFCMMPLTKEQKEFLRIIADEQIEYVRLEFCDTYCRSLGKIVPATDIKNYLQHGFWSPPMWTVAPRHLNPVFDDFVTTSNWKCLLHIDTYKKLPSTICLKTYNQIPTKMARIVYSPLPPYNIMDPRSVCIDRIKTLKKELGYELYSAFEHEFQVFKKQQLSNKEVPCWDNVPFCNNLEILGNGYGSFMVECERSLRAMDIKLEAMHLEGGPGQYEWSMKPTFGIQAADHSFLYKSTIKQIAMTHGLRATFTTTPQCDETQFNSNGAHFNHSLWRDGKNVFFDATSADKLSLIARYWVGGILHHLDSLTAFAVSTVNCYRRINNVHNWSPCTASYGFDNRLVMIRIKVDGNNPNGCYIEYRLACSASNPYHIITSILIAGVDGIKNKILPKYPPHLDPVSDPNLNETYPKIPNNLNAALNALVEDKVICNGFGHKFIDLYVKLKKVEMEMVDEYTQKFGDRNKAEKYLFAKL